MEQYCESGDSDYAYCEQLTRFIRCIFNSHGYRLVVPLAKPVMSPESSYRQGRKTYREEAGLIRLEWHEAPVVIAEAELVAIAGKVINLCGSRHPEIVLSHRRLVSGFDGCWPGDAVSGPGEPNRAGLHEVFDSLSLVSRLAARSCPIPAKVLPFWLRSAPEYHGTVFSVWDRAGGLLLGYGGRHSQSDCNLVINRDSLNLQADYAGDYFRENHMPCMGIH